MKWLDNEQVIINFGDFKVNVIKQDGVSYCATAFLNKAIVNIANKDDAKKQILNYLLMQCKNALNEIEGGQCH